MSITEAVGILDPEGLQPNPLTGEPYSDQYRKAAKQWSTLAAYSESRRILDILETTQLLFVESETGSGKTVLLPKLALHYTGYKGKVVVSLPKRQIAASSARYAAVTLDVPLGGLVGVKYRGVDNSLSSSENRLIYATDGTLINRFLSDPDVKEYDVIIVDEAHERKIQIDLLLLFLKNVLTTGKRPDLKVIIMSATIDVAKYVDYFGVDCKTIKLSGVTNHPVDVKFLAEPTLSYMKTAEKIIGQIPREPILFFITTSDEAFKMCNALRSSKVYCVELYADMEESKKPYAESKDKFLELGQYDQKLVMATNVAESSITIEGLKYVIDSVHEFSSSFEPSTGAKVLAKQLISRAQALQRRGRVGRTEPGTCYHLVTRKQFDQLIPYPVPDILKKDITLEMLQIIVISPGKSYTAGVAMINRLLDAPPNAMIDYASRLYALYGIIVDDTLQAIGEDLLRMADIPINRALFIIFAKQFRCVNEATNIVVMLERIKGKMSNLFIKSANDRDRLATLKRLKVKGSDHLTLLNIYDTAIRKQDPRAWLRQNGLKPFVADIVHAAIKYRLRAQRFMAPPVETNESVYVRLKMALAKSHQHQIKENLSGGATRRDKGKRQVTRQPDTRGRISAASVVLQDYTPSALKEKTVIYDELIKLNSGYEYSGITIL